MKETFVVCRKIVLESGREIESHPKRFPSDIPFATRFEENFDSTALYLSAVFAKWIREDNGEPIKSFEWTLPDHLDGWVEMTVD